MPRLPRLVLVATLLALVAALLSSGSPASARALPSRSTWSAAVRTAMTGSQDFLTQRAAEGASGLAINLDIDNTSLATKYAPGRAVRPVLAFARHAHELGYAVFFNTGRLAANAGGVTASLERVGFTIDALCTREPGERLPVGKKRCRAGYVAQGYTIVANVGNSRTDFAGGDYERAFVLPNYRGQLG